MRIPISQKYILQVFSHFLGLSIFVFASIFVMVNFVQIIIQGALNGFSFYFLFKSIFYLLPNIISMSLPLSFLMAVLLSLGQLSQDGEIVALRAGGFSFTEILAAMFWASVTASVILLAVNNWLGPKTLKRSTDYTLSMINRMTRVELKPRTFQKVSDWVIYSDEVDALSNGLKGVKLIRRVNVNGDPAFVTKINAKEGNYSVLRERGIAIELRDGQFSQTDYKDDNRLIYGDFSSYRTLIPFFSGSEDARKLGPREMSTTALLHRLSEKALDAETGIRYRIEIVSRLAMALTPLVFFLIGAPLGVVLEKKGRSAGFAISLLIIFFYYGFSITSMVLTRKYAGLFPWALFIPGAVCAALGLWMWKRRLYAR